MDQRPKTTRQLARLALGMPRVAWARLRAGSPRSPRFAGAYASRAQAIAALPPALRAGYDDPDVAEVSFDQMCLRESWDYPLIFWLDRLLKENGTVIDAGGHMGTKYIAFSQVLDLGKINWTVYDLPGIVAAARARQSAGGLPGALGFADRTDALPAPDMLLASGLLQYLDTSFSDLVSALPRRPRHILLNKVAVRAGPAVFTHERIGQARVPYHIRAQDDWQAEIDALGYDVRDTWDIPALGHLVPTHPWLGPSTSRGYLLERKGKGNG